MNKNAGRIIESILAVVFVVIGSFSFVGFVISNHFVPSPSVMQNDWYYCLLVPLTLPIVVVAVYFHWLSMKLFKHS